MENVMIDIRNMNDWIKDRFAGKDFVSLEDFFGDYEQLIFDYEHLEEEFEDYQNMVDDCYKPKSAYEMYGVSERDFH